MCLKATTNQSFKARDCGTDISDGYEASIEANEVHGIIRAKSCVDIATWIIYPFNCSMVADVKHQTHLGWKLDWRW